MAIYTDRSRVLRNHTCPRARWWEYEFPTGNLINGVVSTKLDMNLLLGSTFHMGVQSMLTGYELEESVKRAIYGNGAEWPGMWELLKNRGLILGENENVDYVTQEQVSLAEALIRAYWYAVLPDLLFRFNIVEVEQEHQGHFGELNWGMRADAVLMEKDSLDLYVLSLKTTKEYGKRAEDSARHDMQGMSEVATIDQKLEEWQELASNSRADLVPKWFIDRMLTGALPKCMGVTMQYALKGRREEYPKESGRYTYNNALIRPWRKGEDLEGAHYAFKFEIEDELGSKHRLGKGWNRINIWEDMGVKEWIEKLANEEIQGFPMGYALLRQLALPVDFFRHDEDIEEWAISTEAEEVEVARKANLVRKALVTNPKNYQRELAKNFPKHTKSCDWPSKCIYQEICFGPTAYTFDPISSQIFTIREANHPTEEKWE